MTGRKRGVTILAETLKTSGAITAPAHVVVPELKASAVPWQHDPRRGRFLVPLAAFDDVLARLELAGHHVEIIGGATLW